MDPEMALQVIRTLSEGVDPLTGEEMSTDSAVQHPRVVRALLGAVAALEKETDRARRRKDQPRQSGLPWTEQEEQALVEAHERGATLKELASAHERSAYAIEARLLQLGKLDSTPLLARRHHNA